MGAARSTRSGHPRTRSRGDPPAAHDRLRVRPRRSKRDDVPARAWMVWPGCCGRTWTSPTSSGADTGLGLGRPLRRRSGWRRPQRGPVRRGCDRGFARAEQGSLPDGLTRSVDALTAATRSRAASRLATTDQVGHLRVCLALHDPVDTGVVDHDEVGGACCLPSGHQQLCGTCDAASMALYRSVSPGTPADRPGPSCPGLATREPGTDAARPWAAGPCGERVRAGGRLESPMSGMAGWCRFTGSHPDLPNARLDGGGWLPFPG